MKKQRDRYVCSAFRQKTDKIFSFFTVVCTSLRATFYFIFYVNMSHDMSNVDS